MVAAVAVVAAEEIAIAAIVFFCREPSSFVLYEQNSLTPNCNEL